MGWRDSAKNIKKRILGNITSYPIEVQQINDLIGGVSEEEMYLLFGTTGSSKTKLLIICFVLNMVDYVLANPEKDIKIRYFTLELSQDEIYLNIFCHILHKKTGKKYSIKYFRNKLKDKPLDLSIFEEFALVAEYMDFFDSKVTIIDDIHQPSKIYEYVVNELENVYGEVMLDEKGKKVYVKHNPNELYLILVDTLNALKREPKMDKYETLHYWCADLCKQSLKIFYKCSVCDTQQMDFVFIIIYNIFVQQFKNVVYEKSFKRFFCR